LNGLFPTDGEAHDLIYDNYLVENIHFYEWLEIGREVIDAIDYV
jgi:hypothetical protein